MSESLPVRLGDAAALVALGYVPVVGPALAEVWTLAVESRRARVERFGVILRDRVQDDDRLLEALRAERVAEMFLQAAQDAARQADAQRVAALATAVAADITGMVELDMAELEARVLGRLSAGAAAELARLHTLAESGEELTAGPEEALTAELIGEGLVVPATVYNGGVAPERLTALGVRVLERLRA